MNVLYGIQAMIKEMSEYAECKRSVVTGNYKINKANRGRVDLGLISFRGL